MSENLGSDHFTVLLIAAEVSLFLTLTLDCRFECDKNGTIGGFCNKTNGFCQCKDGFHGDNCNNDVIIIDFMVIKLCIKNNIVSIPIFS